MKRSLVVVCAALLVTTACGKSEAEKQAEEVAKAAEQIAKGAEQAAKGAEGSVAEGLQQMAKGLQQMGQGTAAKPVDFEALIALIPEMSGWTRSKPRGEQQTAMGMSTSKAEARYEKGESSIDLDITDSSLNQIFLAPFMMFMASGYSERSSDGYTKSAPVNGHPGFEKWENEPKRGEITIVVGNRFLVQANGRDVENLDQVRQLVQAIDLAKLASLK